MYIDTMNIGFWHINLQFSAYQLESHKMNDANNIPTIQKRSVFQNMYNKVFKKINVL